MDSSEGRPKITRPLPSIRDFILCDRVIRDQFQGKASLIDVFENIQSYVFPAQHRCMYYITLVDGHGDFEFEVVLRNIESGKEVPIWNARVCLDPVKPAALVSSIAPVFETPGLYEFVLRSANGKTLGTRTFTVARLPNQIDPVI